MSIQGDIAREYLRKYPSLSSRKMADVLIREVPQTFTDHEKTRQIVRYYRGSHGQKDRKKLTDETYIPKISFPNPDEDDFSVFGLSYNDFPIAVAGDVHIPFYDQDALEIFIERAIAINAKTLVMAGDWLDFYQLSRFLKDPRKRSATEEIALFKDILASIRKALPKARIIYKLGNHEERWDAYVMQHAPELFDMENIRFDGALDLKSFNVEVVGNKRLVRMGHLYGIHGHEYVFSISNPVNPARGLYNRAKKSSICFHFHQTSEHTETGIDGKAVTTWTGGCLCGLRPLYMPLNKWNHGFMEIYSDDEGSFSVSNRKIINYKVV